jgi:hypothetical protein
MGQMLEDLMQAFAAFSLGGTAALPRRVVHPFMGKRSGLK